jgi:hypothetical protein
VTFCPVDIGVDDEALFRSEGQEEQHMAAGKSGYECFLRVYISGH